MTTLYRKYRPKAWTEVAGQNHVKVTLGFEIASGKIAHAYLFSGPRGTGKTTTARIFARAVNCGAAKDGDPCGECESCTSVLENRSLDVIEIDAASHRGIDAVRENIIENSRFSPSQLKYKVFIIDEVHMLTTEAFNALLKTLEEPPAHAVFILATTELHKVPATILSRCQRFDFRKIPFAEMVERLEGLAQKEKVKVDKRTIEAIARQADGGLRDAESLLGKVLTMGDGKKVTHDEALVVLPRSDAQAVTALVDALLHRDARSAVQTLADCAEGGVDLDQFANDAIEALRKTLLTKMSGNPDVFSAEMDEEGKRKLVEWAALCTVPELVVATETLMEKRREIRVSHPPQLPLELAAVRICEGVPTAPAAIAAPTPAPTPKAPPSPAAPAAPAPKPAVQEAPEKTGPVAAPAAAAAPAAPAAAATSGAAFLHDSGEPICTVAHLKSVWVQFVNKAGELNAGLPYILGVATPVEVRGVTVHIGFDFAFHRDKLNQEKNRRHLETALSAVLGKDARVEGILLEKKEGDADTAPTFDFAPMGASLAPAAAGAGGDSLAAFGGRVVE